MRRLILATLLAAAAATPVVAQDYYGSGYDDRRAGDDGGQRDIRSVADFEAPLARYGRWVPSRFGRAWHPNVGSDWRPYTVGHWVDGPDGQTWDSDEPWGWATYHYGRWGFDDRYGWVWVPGTEWAPAWVAWRDGDDYSGWAPLPPGLGDSVYGYGAPGYDNWYEPSWVYVPRGSIYSARVYSAILPWRDNRRLWERTRERQGGRDWQHGRDNGRQDRSPNDPRRGNPGAPQAGWQNPAPPPPPSNWQGGRPRRGDEARPPQGSSNAPPRSDWQGHRPDRDGGQPPRGDDVRRPWERGNGNTGIVPPGVAPPPASPPAPHGDRHGWQRGGDTGNGAPPPPSTQHLDRGERPRTVTPPPPASPPPGARPERPAPTERPAPPREHVDRPSDHNRNPETHEKPE